ncbi:nuclear transport factor 2 family protein [Hymenobacter cellulosilyticus]|uniref:Nuclear transport factor 2 family protein n=1 Tax=Hymenobacter cellulosilyticus TaxID=2932248 RepID=A0A8T9Q591_9BACT|nr:nuclear transport factor 2 family protein [Hymenobacter cellulosilyticus]UOQ71088.1 nuclear transport factor 2 family protein [Hymenobacter cellulosilyticus]
MNRLFLAALLLLPASAALAQSSPSETAAVKKTITTFFDGMRKGDSTMVRNTLATGVVLHTIMSRNGVVQTGTEKAAEFLRLVGTPHKEVYDERISFEQVLVDANLASVWTPYQFYVGSKFSHCGYNSFQLVKFAEGWRIVHIIDTRRKDGCK